jgi:hypothetical protein
MPQYRESPCEVDDPYDDSLYFPLPSYDADEYPPDE